MKIKALITFLYAFLVLIGGITGYTKAGSIPSLAMGIAFAILLFLSAVGQYKRNMQAHYSAVILTALLALFFLSRFIKTLSFMPAGVMVIISVLVLIPLIAMPNNGKAK